MTDITWELQTVELSKLKGYEKNPRKMTARQAEKLEESLTKFGVCQPIVANADFTIIGGHQRCVSLKKLRVKQTAVYVPSRLLADNEVEELNIRLNKNQGFFDYDILANEFDALDLVDWGFSIEEFEVESLPYDESKEGSEKKQSKKAKMYITFEKDEDLQAAENRISTIVDEFKGASYKVKLGA